METKNRQELLTLEEISKILRVTKRTIYNYINSGELKKINLSRKNVLISRKELENFMRKYYG